MAEKVYPATNTMSTDKPTTINGGANPAIPFPPTRSQVYNRPQAYRPRPPSPKRRRSCCRSCCLITTLLIVVILLLAAISSAVLYLLYHPHRPTFTISSFQVSHFNLTSTQYDSKFNFTLTARNPNKKIKFFYEPVTITAFSDGSDVHIADGSFPNFMLDTKNTTFLQTVLVSPPNLSAGELSTLQSEAKKNSLPLKIQLDTKVRVKIGSLKTKKLRLRVKCNGAKLNVPGGKPASVGITSGVKCKVDLRVKIWKWTV